MFWSLCCLVFFVDLEWDQLVYCSFFDGSFIHFFDRLYEGRCSYQFSDSSETPLEVKKSTKVILKEAKIPAKLVRCIIDNQHLLLFFQISEWKDKESIGVLEHVILHKFNQNEELKAKLLETGDKMVSGTAYQGLETNSFIHSFFTANPWFSITLVEKTKLPYEKLDHIICGTVIQGCKTSNREVALLAGVPDNIPAHTVTLACISSNVAITTGMGMLATGNANAIIAGGVELLSDVPIRYNRKARKAMLGMNKANDFLSKLKIGGEIVKNLLSPELPAVAEFSTGETMGHSGDRLAAAFNVSRRKQNEFAIRSHTLASKPPKRKLHRFRTGVLDGKKPKLSGDNGSVSPNGCASEPHGLSPLHASIRRRASLLSYD
ncbi:hypothetical protein CRE_27937 [Caenorhabditis remanei]|uniref:Thiolase N-terminal domain-containing protein n=1 Tax=Caenorhabditis remanei TaxID=31234 RepID=E3NNS4_CAERE|nr:hypothetical protein CRE_27937 [Caenorhabditis remanei]